VKSPHAGLFGFDNVRRLATALNLDIVLLGASRAGLNKTNNQTAEATVTLYDPIIHPVSD
jgi:hypothetical protein